ncbi:MAG: D-Ala-D-Ala carboxypeptidase family metallohydrolase [Prevotella sp.]|uniref:D-Ala-D-Ala carboxypeptidase family metallohydrolase n=1 Tax=Prevotella sp. TaxID=59823 RepID=UPI002A285EA2|nr:D-Ala-D-Ala carboxypeptidase family metallohydrolase [Prevotella sp.]MDD7317841.1 D-Ala-D-Ala carboxypeptidase family metallohydrolase [Prevotellaceae bacterium]MDY4020756.1 D-Ala-D-Ala carboxypeptidase family metallohydrolase [Prevotella sp.]
METTIDMGVRLTEHFTLKEMCQSGTAVRMSIDNVPDEKTVERLKALCVNVLEPTRRRFGVLRVTSGYRCPQLNKAVNGAQNSQHMRGEAADIHVSSMEVGRKMYDFIKKNTAFDQLIFEHSKSTGATWLHVSYSEARSRRHAIPYYGAA